MIPGAKHEQDDCALFFQLMCQLRSDRYREREGEGVITDLADMIFYMDFSGIFDRRGSSHTQQIRREKAKDMFRPEGVTLDFGSGPNRYVSFERSASMSRQSRLSFIRADLYVIMRQRIMLDMTLDRCQLSKLYAYNGLMFSSGTRVDGIRIDKPHRVIVVDNPKKLMQRVPVITVVEGDKYGKYYREETIEDINITCFDGVGLISKEYAETVDKAYCGRHCHTSFQIRLPYIKGMLHQVDFKDFLKRSGTQVIQDIWGINHPIQNVDIILTRSQFKADRWLQENDMSWKDYWKAFRKFRHALYITNTNKEQAESLVALNYQFLCQRLFPQKVFFGRSESTAQKPCVHSCRDAEQKSPLHQRANLHRRSGNTGENTVKELRHRSPAGARRQSVSLRRSAGTTASIDVAPRVSDAHRVCVL